jgi:hypothetical protein
MIEQGGSASRGCMCRCTWGQGAYLNDGSTLVVHGTDTPLGVVALEADIKAQSWGLH